MSLVNIQLPLRPSKRGEPVWEVFGNMPLQGGWSVDLYRKLPQKSPLIEYDDGFLEVLPMPTWLHNEIAAILWSMLRVFIIDGRLGKAALPPLNLHTTLSQYRHPDLMYLAPRSLDRFRNDFWDYADLVVEVVSPDDADRDYVKKRAEYAAAGFPEYWIIDLEAKCITVLTLDGNAYREAGVYPAGQAAASLVAPGFKADLADLLRQANA